MVRQFRKQWLKWHGGYERRAFRIFQNTFKEIANGIPFDKITDNTYKDLIDFYVSIDKITEAYSRVYLDIGIVHGKRVGRQINQQINKKNFKPDEFTSKYQRDVNKWVVENGGKRIVSVRGNYVKYVNALIEKGLKENKSKRQIAADIQRLLKSRGFYRYESERIARTETTTASNYAATVSSSVSGVLMDKIWISALDNRTRRPPNSPFDHYDMNLKRVKLEDDFIVSGESMPFPAAPSGKDGKETSAGNVINCRCAVAQVVRTEQIEAPEPVIKEPVIQEVIPIIEEVEEVIDEVANVEKFEEEIRNNKFESMGVFDSKGNLIFRKKGTKTEVNISFAEGLAARGKIMTHNHPNYLYTDFSGSFSPADVRVTGFYNIKEMRAVSQKRVFILKLKNGGKFGLNDKWAKQVEKDAKKLQNKVARSSNAWIREGKGIEKASRKDFAEANQWHWVWEEFFKNSKEFEYTGELLNPYNYNFNPFIKRFSFDEEITEILEDLEVNTLDGEEFWKPTYK